MVSISTAQSPPFLDSAHIIQKYARAHRGTIPTAVQIYIELQSRHGITIQDVQKFRSIVETAVRHPADPSITQLPVPIVLRIRGLVKTIHREQKRLPKKPKAVKPSHDSLESFLEDPTHPSRMNIASEVRLALIPFGKKSGAVSAIWNKMRQDPRLRTRLEQALNQWDDQVLRNKLAARKKINERPIKEGPPPKGIDAIKRAIKRRSRRRT